ncbi:MAG TPA: sugar phosphate nucleotidyltransferase [Anaerolineae bacterium]|nr:sugar phosphate nucleotidyltransferase [Anaerolineae bacterium]
MHITKAVITAAGRNQRTLPLQTLIDRDGAEKSVLAILIEEALSAGIEEIAVVVAPGDEKPYADVVGDHAGRLHFIPQTAPRGYGHAIYCAKDFVGDAPFLHLVGDHLYVSSDAQSCAQQLVTVAAAEACAVSAVQATREHLLPYYGAVGGKRVAGRKDLYEIDTVIEKPTPTEAELRLIVPGLRAGHYLCFFGMHVLTPTVMEILGGRIANSELRTANSESADQRINESASQPSVLSPQSSALKPISLSDALAVLATREKYLALEEHALRYDVGVKYGLLTAQLALALNGADHDEVLTRLLELLSARELRRGA